jgi:hypothetical protein
MVTREAPHRLDGRRDHIGRFPPAPVREHDSKQIRRLRCIDVARNRAQRYARRHRKARSLLPLISIAIFAALLLERGPVAFSSRKKDLHRPSNRPLPVAENDDAKVAQASIRDGEGGPQYRPSPDFLARDVAQVVAFLIRNRGRLDTETVRAKWVFLDRASLPLAIFLREIEANGTWDELKNEIKTTPATGLRGPRTEMPKSLWHRKILAILPDWTKRGDDLLRGAGTEGPSLETAPDKGRGRAGHRTADAVRQASALTYSPRRHPHRAE